MPSCCIPGEAAHVQYRRYTHYLFIITVSHVPFSKNQTTFLIPDGNYCLSLCNYKYVNIFCFLGWLDNIYFSF